MSRISGIDCAEEKDVAVASRRTVRAFLATTESPLRGRTQLEVMVLQVRPASWIATVLFCVGRYGRNGPGAQVNQQRVCMSVSEKRCYVLYSLLQSIAPSFVVTNRCNNVTNDNCILITASG